ncbi:DUF4831 family protein [Megalodesulfovibrio paquesii]
MSILLAVAVVVSACSAKHTVVKLEPGNGPPADGVAYVLPKNLIKVEVPVVVSTANGFCVTNPDTYKIAGELVLLGVKLVSCKELKEKGQRVSFGTPKLSLETQPDNNHWYAIKLPKSRTQDVSVDITLNAMGVLTKADAAVADKKLETAVQVIKVAAGIAGTVLMGGANTLLSNKAIATEPKPMSQDFGSLLREDKSVSSSAITVLLNLLKDYSDKLDALNTEKFNRASADTLKFQQQNIESRISKIRELLSGYGKNEMVVTLYVDPEDSVQSYPLMHVVEQQGNQTLAVALKQQERVPPALSKMISFVKDPGPPAGTIASLALEVTPSKVPFAKVEDVALMKGYRYRIPGWAELNVKYNKDILANTKMQIAQFGMVASLPEDFKSSDTTLLMELYEQTGAIQKVKVGTKATMLEQTKAVGEAASSIGEAISTIKASSSEAAKLKEEVEQLEYLKKKLELQEELNSLLQKQ